MATSTLVGYLVALVAALTLGVAGLISHHAISRAADERHVASGNVLLAEQLRATFALANAAHRGYLVTGELEMQQAGDQHSAEFRELLATAARNAHPEQRGPLLSLIEREGQHAAAVSRAAELRSQGESRAVLSEFFSKEVVPRRELVLASLDALQAARAHDLEVAEQTAARAQAGTLLGLLGLLPITLVAIAAAALSTRRAQRQEQATVTAWTRFLSIASHDLKTPLSTLAMRVEILKRLQQAGTLDGSRLQNEFGRLSDAVKNMAELVGSILDLSRLRAGVLTLTPEAVNLADVVSAVVGRMRDSFDHAGVELTVETVAATGKWDRMRIEQVTTNLLSNSLKYGDGKPVQVDVQVDHEWARLSVRDHGKGIPQPQRDRIFEPFARLEQPDTSGHGLGLFIVRSIVEAHGGRIRVESAQDAGSMFLVELPRMA